MPVVDVRNAEPLRIADLIRNRDPVRDADAFRNGDRAAFLRSELSAGNEHLARPSKPDPA
jgi:hypothetical protein